MKYFAALVFLLMHFVLTEEKPTDNRTSSKLSESKEDEENGKEMSFADSTEQLGSTEPTSTTENNSDPFSEKILTINRTFHSRMRQFEERTTISPSSSTEFDYWWYFTTPRRPRFSYRDFPGRPGVATWREISPSVEKESKKNLKSEQPMAAGVLSEANLVCHSAPTAILLTLTLYQYYLKALMN